ncbi:MAG TPA: glutamate-1-semialdehyde 2,1-aminomutase [Armatimonadota bacterium]|nr:glutamate-1-semialdehyde 2,1-aminomutase [Armatimonadota bacterium]
MRRDTSVRLFERAVRVIPGGVNSPARAFRAVGGDPPFIERGRGSRIWDVDGNEYIDYVGSWGPLILGHAPERLVREAREAVGRGSSFGAATRMEVEFAEALADAVPSIEMVRLVTSGTEAVMSAVRLARGFTGRDKIIKMAGGYHGHSDGLLAKAGSTAATFGLPDSAGVPRGYTEGTLTVPYNDLEAVEAVLGQCGAEVACVILEPIAGNMGVVPPREGYLEGLRDLTQKHGCLLVFDEVITGFRVGYSGAQGLYGVTPDLTTLGKIIGGGFPIGAYGGRRDIMEHMAPVGSINQAGTLAGNPVAVSVGLEMLRALREPGVYERLEARAAALAEGLASAAKAAGVPMTINRVGSMMTPFFCAGPVTDWETADQSDRQAFARFFRHMLDTGVYLPPSQMEALFVSTAHTSDDINRTVALAAEALRA